MGFKRATLYGRTFGFLFSLSLVMMIAVMVVVTGVSFSVYEGEAERMLMSQAESVSGLIGNDSEHEATLELEDTSFVDTRCTLIAQDGTVLYDNWTDPAAMDNHANREEVMKAREGDQCIMIRKSETLGSDTLYAATLLKNGDVLRLAETRTSLTSFMADLALPLALSLAALVVFSLIASRLLTKLIIRPLQELNLSKPLDNNAYRELQPLLKRVDAQRIELMTKNKSLEDAVEMRREFTSNVSHEMKTPLQVISGYAELMENGMTDPADNQHFASLIHQEALVMRSLIDDVLTISKLDESVDTESMPIELGTLAKHIAKRLEPKAKERGEHILVSTAKDVIVRGSTTRAEQVIYNLVDNAIRYNRDGGVVSVCVDKHGDNARLRVSDEGPGIPVEMRERVFERFFRLDSSRSRETGGTGLGLAIVKHAVESLNGRIHIEDAPCQGTCFVVEIPLREMM